MKNLWIILIIGIAIRIFLSFATFHPDVQAFYLGGKVVSSGNILNLYDYSSKDAVFNYPPLIYWFHGVFSLLPFSNYGFVKLPYLIFDILVVLILLKLFSTQNSRRLAVILWMFNPISLYATYMMGQFDIIPTFFTFLSFYLISKNELNLAALALGGGIAFKLYPVFLFIPLIILGKTFWDKFRLGILAVLPYLLSIAPYLSQVSFRSTAFFTNQSSKSLYAGIPVSGGESILLFPALLILFYLFVWQKGVEKFFFWRIYLIPLLLFFIFTHYHPQWLIWITPFLILDLVIYRFKNWLAQLLIFGSWVGSLFFFDPSLTIGIFTPLFPSSQNIADIWTLSKINVDYNLARSMLQTIFAAASLYLIFKYFPGNEKA